MVVVGIVPARPADRPAAMVAAAARRGAERMGLQASGGGPGRGRRPGRAGWRHSLAERLRAYFFAGLIVTAPVAITLLIVWWVVRYVDTTLAVIIPERYNPETYLPFGVPGVGLITALALVMLAGWFTAGIVGGTLMRLGGRILDRTPVVRAIYGTLKQVFETLFQQSSRAFREVVLVEFPRPGAYALGFVTGTSDPEIHRAAGETLTNVLVPMSPFPSSGFLLFVPEAQLVRLDMTVEEGMKVVLSGGIVGPSALREARRSRPPGAPVPASPELVGG